MKNESRLDWLAAGLLGRVTFVVLAAGASRLGFYADDARWLNNIPRIDSLGGLWATVRNYMPGRNLHPLWHYLTYQLVGGDPLSHLPALHCLQSALDGLAVAVLYFVLRSARLPAAWLAAGGFAFWPIMNLSGQPPGSASPILPSLGCFQTLRFRRFPQSSRLRIDFFRVSATSPPALLRRIEADVRP